MNSKEIKFNQGLGQLVRVSRRRLGMTQADVAKKIGVSFQQVQKYESGQTTIPVYRLHQISEILETSFAGYITDFADSGYRVLDAARIEKILQDLKLELTKL